jgi:D-alanine transaminase
MESVYLNGDWVVPENATVSIFDRGLQFADSVYEVTAVVNGNMIDNDAHIDRLFRSLSELKITIPLTKKEIREIHQQLIKRNRLEQGIIYMQITRGEAARDFVAPEGIRPTIIAYTSAKNLVDAPVYKTGAKVMTVEDIRWHRRDIKTTMLLAQSMAKSVAVAHGFDDAWMVQHGLITEGTANNAFIINRRGELQTRGLSQDILPGITRKALLELARQEGLTINETAFSVADACAAKEAFSTGSSAFVVPVVQIDAQVIGDGAPGYYCQRLREIYLGLS